MHAEQGYSNRVSTCVSAYNYVSVCGKYLLWLTQTPTEVHRALFLLTSLL